VGTLTFDGLAGQRISLLLEDQVCGFIGNPPPFAYAQISLISPSGAILTTVPFQRKDFPPPVSPPSIEFAYIDALTLPATGKYTILIDPNDTFFPVMCSGQFRGFGATARLYDVPPDITGTIAASGQPTTVNFDAPGQKATLTFNGFNGQRIALRSSQSELTVYINRNIDDQLKFTRRHYETFAITTSRRRRSK